MEQLYTVCALGGGTLLVCQFLLTLFGFGHHDLGGHGGLFHDVSHGGAGHDSGSSWFVSILTFRTIVVALTFFGLVGRAATASGSGPPRALGMALAAGAAAMALVAWLMQSLSRLSADGTVRIQRAVGQSGTVYLPIPAGRTGVGKVTLTLQNRTVEYQAITPDARLPTGARVVVLGVVSPDTVEVVPIPDSARTSHA